MASHLKKHVPSPHVVFGEWLPRKMPRRKRMESSDEDEEGASSSEDSSSASESSGDGEEDDETSSGGSGSDAEDDDESDDETEEESDDKPSPRQQPKPRVRAPARADSLVRRRALIRSDCGGDPRDEALVAIFRSAISAFPDEASDFWIIGEAVRLALERLGRRREPVRDLAQACRSGVGVASTAVYKHCGTYVADVRFSDGDRLSFQFIDAEIVDVVYSCGSLANMALPAAACYSGSHKAEQLHDEFERLRSYVNSYATTDPI
jgi:hypothetical protein